MASFSRGLSPQFLLLVRPQAPCKCAATPQPAAHLLFRLSRSPLQPYTPSRLVQYAARAKPPPKASPAASTAAAPKPTPKPAPKAAAPKPSPPKPAPKPNPKNGPLLTASTTTPSPSRIVSFATQLALKNRVTLYEAPSHFWYRFSSFSAAAFCVTYTTYQYWSIYLHPLPDMTWWLPHAYGLICVFMASVGVYFFMGTARIIRSIDACSVSSLLAANKGKLPKALARAAGEGAQSPIYIEVETQRMVPFLPRRKIQVWPDQVQLPFRMADAVAVQQGGNGVAGKAPMTLKAQVEAAKAEREAKEAARKYTMDHLLTAPFRDAKKGASTMWQGIARAFHREGFAKLTVGNWTYKLDVTGGWALDNGRAMDRILPVKQIRV